MTLKPTNEQIEGFLAFHSTSPVTELGFVGGVDLRDLLRELLAKREECEALAKDQQDWRKGVDYIRTPLVKFANKTLPTLSCVDIGRAVLELCAELDAVKWQRDELLEAAKLAIREIRPSTDCSMCHDSTWDHECDSKVNTTHVALSSAIKGALAASQPAQQPKPEVRG